MQFCQNTIQPKKETKLCLRVEKWSRSVEHLFLIFTQSLLNPPLCRFHVWSVNIFIYNMCFFSANNFADAQTLYRMRSLCRSSMFIWSYSWIYEYYVGKHWMLYWMQENRTATYLPRSRLFTYDIMKNFNCN